MEKIKLMAHLVAGFPTDDLALTAARALVAGGADILEIQSAICAVTQQTVAVSAENMRNKSSK